MKNVNDLMSMNGVEKCKRFEYDAEVEAIVNSIIKKIIDENNENDFIEEDDLDMEVCKGSYTENQNKINGFNLTKNDACSKGKLESNCNCNKEIDLLPKKVIFFTASGIEKKAGQSYDVAIAKAKAFDSKYGDSLFIQIDEDCEIVNSFNGCEMETSDIYCSRSSAWSNWSELHNTIGMLELRDKNDGNKYVYVKTFPLEIQENCKSNKDQVKVTEDYMMLIYDKGFSENFDLIKNYIASESIDNEFAKDTQPSIIAGVQFIK